MVGAAAAVAAVGLASGVSADHADDLPYPNCGYVHAYGYDSYGYGDYGYETYEKMTTRLGGEEEWTFFGDSHPDCVPFDSVPAPPNYPPPFESPPPPAPFEPPMTPTPETPTPTVTETPSMTPSTTPSTTPSKPSTPTGAYAYGYTPEDGETPEDGFDPCICTLDDYQVYVGVMTAAQSMGTYGFLQGSRTEEAMGEFGDIVNGFGLNLSLELCSCDVTPTSVPVSTPTPTPVVTDPEEEAEEEAEVEAPVKASKVTATFNMSPEDVLKTDLADMAAQAAAAAMAAAGEGSTVITTTLIVIKTQVTSTDPSVKCINLAGKYAAANGVTLPSETIKITCAKNGVVTFDSTVDSLPETETTPAADEEAAAEPVADETEEAEASVADDEADEEVVAETDVSEESEEAEAGAQRKLLQESNTFDLSTIFPEEMKEEAAAAALSDLSGLCDSAGEGETCGVSDTTMAVDIQLEIIQSLSDGAVVPDLSEGLGESLADFSADFAAENGIDIVMEELPEIVDTTPSPPPAETPVVDASPPPTAVVEDPMPPPPTVVDPDTKDKKDVPVGAIAGGVVGGVVVVGAGVFFFFRNKRKG